MSDETKQPTIETADQRRARAAKADAPKSEQDESSADERLAQLKREEAEIVIKAARATAQKQVELQKKKREEQRAKDSVPTICKVVHGRYVDHVNYTHEDPDQPPAEVGQFITIPAREATRLRRDGIVEIVAGA